MKKGNRTQVEYSEDGKTLIKVSRHYKGELIIPEGVTTIGRHAFNRCEKLTKIVFPDSLTTIGGFAFYNCGISEIEIPGTIKVIHYGTFQWCKNLKKVILHEGIEEIKKEAFCDCAITEIVIPKSVTSIGSIPFPGCPIESIIVEEGNTVYDSRENCNAIIKTESNCLILGSKNTKIPESVSSIRYAFYCHKTLESIYIPKNITSIGRRAFMGCSKLSIIEVDKDNPVYDSRENCNAIIETATNKLIAGCGRTTIPHSVNSIEEFAFVHCESLTELNIPDSIIEIGNGAFMGCSYLKTVRLPKDLKQLNTCLFNSCILLEKIEIPEGVESIKGGAFASCDELRELEIPQSVTFIHKKAFNGGHLQRIKVHPLNPVYDSRENCNAIIERATDKLIAGCSKTTIPNSVKSIADEAFICCYELTEITIPEGVINIGDYAFYVCDDLTCITLPSTLQSVGEDAFEDTNLTQIIIPLGHKERFSKMTNLKKYKKLFVERT